MGGLMRVAIAQVDGKWPNLALAKIAAWALRRGDTVEWFNPLFGADFVYASKVFTDTPDSLYLPQEASTGGSGYDLHRKLIPEVEGMKPDWSLWPTWPHDMGFTTRGCVRKCPFCIVPEKEGSLRVVAEFGDLTTGRPTMILHDNNVTAAPIEHFRQFCADATAAGVRLDFHQGLDARLLTDEHAAIIKRSRFLGRLHMAFDNMADETAVVRSAAIMSGAGIPMHRLTYLILVGFETDESQDLHRIEVVRGLGADPFVMPFDRHDRYQRDLARWCNGHAIRNVAWKDYSRHIDNRRRVT